MPSLQQTIQWLRSLIAFPSVSSTSNADVSERAGELLDSLGFQVEQTEYLDARGLRKVNLIARRDPFKSHPNTHGGLAYFCHTDVVPADGWTGPGGDPFEGVVQGNKLFGRGSCDMKGSLATMLAAAAEFSSPQQVAPLWIVCTADEEVGFDGAKHLVRDSSGYRELVQMQPLAIIGEPTGLSVVHAHKGITGCNIISRGRAAHSSTTDGINANEAMVPMLQTLLEIGEQTKVDRSYHDDRFDPPTLSWNFGVSDHCDAVNITPHRSVAWFSLRPMPEIDGEDLIARAEARAQSLGLDFQRFAGGGTFWIDTDADCIRTLCELAGTSPQTVCYGTDGGEFKELHQRVVLGPGDIAQAHTTDEWIDLEQIRQGTELYKKVIHRWCIDPQPM
ncbi:MAG: M20 family metallopeptidase [Pirellulales bacterium]|nr:M20 family metallopeptidase [Pirellulales bacterium]